MLGRGKLNIIIDGQFGSTGKGLLSAYVGTKFNVDVAVTNASPNAGHTFYVDNKKYITHHLPVTGVLNKNSIIYLCPGAIINPVILLEELSIFDCSDRVYIHPRAAVIEKQDIEDEQEGSVKKIASTRSGVGSALARKIKRSASLAKDNEILKPMVKELDLNHRCSKYETVVMEVPQGLDLSINSGFSYPHCTSREITISAALADAQVHPEHLGSVMVCIRTYPIRVGHIVEKGKIVGDSGPFYPDSIETSWANIGVEEEMTTVTGRVRRVATFSMIQYKKMLKAFKPDYILLNFTNYLSEKELSELLKELPEVSHISNGPKIEDIKDIGKKLTIYDGVYEMTNTELRGIKDEIIKNAFPELMDSDIAIEFVVIEDSFMQVGELEDEGHFIEVDESLIKIRGDREEVDVLKGGIAHELAHIVKKSSSLLNKWIEKFLCRVSWKFKELDERNTDLTVVLRGYGKELLKFLEYCEKDYSRYKGDGLSQIGNFIKKGLMKYLIFHIYFLFVFSDSCG